MKIGNREFDFMKQAYIMGILNVTPDSFSDGGKFNGIDRALEHAEQMIHEGADIIDIGGESTRPGYAVVPAEEEIDRVVPVIKAIKERFDIPISIDTCKGAVAAAALDAGADMLNDIWGFQYDPSMALLAAKRDVPCVLMHNKANSEYNAFPEDYIAELKACAEAAISKGVKRENIILDPGIGFGKTYEQNLIALAHLEELNALGYPVLLGTSRKSVIGITLDLPSDQRMEGTIATTVIGFMKGCSLFRVHDVKENRRALEMSRAVMAYAKADEKEER